MSFWEGRNCLKGYCQLLYVKKSKCSFYFFSSLTARDTKLSLSHVHLDSKHTQAVLSILFKSILDTNWNYLHTYAKQFTDNFHTGQKQNYSWNFDLQSDFNSVKNVFYYIARTSDGHYIKEVFDTIINVTPRILHKTETICVTTNKVKWLKKTNMRHKIRLFLKLIASPVKGILWLLHGS